MEILDCKNLQGQQICSHHLYKVHGSTYRRHSDLFYFLGKKLETVRQIFHDVFEEADWRQPSVVLLDDLDQIAGAPTSPEHEHGPDAMLQRHVAQSKSVYTCAKQNRRTPGC